MLPPGVVPRARVGETQYTVPRASTGQTASTRSPRMATIHSCRFTVGSIWPGTSRTLSPSASAGPSPTAIQHRVFVRHAAHRPPRERRLRRSGVGRERLQPGVERGAIAAGVVPPAHHRGQDEERLVEHAASAGPARSSRSRRPSGCTSPAGSRVYTPLAASKRKVPVPAPVTASHGSPAASSASRAARDESRRPTRSRDAVPRRRGDAARIRSTPAGHAGAGSVARRSRARARPRRRDRRRPRGRGRHRVRRRRRGAPPRDRTPSPSGSTIDASSTQTPTRAAGKRAASAARFASLRAPTTSLVTSTSPIPPARKGSASEVFCTQMPTAPAATCRRAISTHLWLLACGRTRTLRPATACIRRAMLASNRSRSTISAGVSTSASASPGRAGIQRLSMRRV